MRHDFICTPDEEVSTHRTDTIRKELEDSVAAIPVVGDRYNAEQQKQVGT